MPVKREITQSHWFLIEMIVLILILCVSCMVGIRAYKFIMYNRFLTCITTGARVQEWDGRNAYHLIIASHLQLRDAGYFCSLVTMSKCQRT